MFEAIARVLSDLVDPAAGMTFADDDPRLAVAALLVHAIVVDGRVTEAEETMVRQVLHRLYGLDARATGRLRDAGGAAAAAAVDVGPFIADLARRISAAERLALVEALWQAAYADGQLHEFEEDLLWRIAAPLGISEADRDALQRKILALRQPSADPA